MALIDITPIMTSNVAPFPFEVIPSNVYKGMGAYDGWKAFDNDANSYWCTDYKLEVGYLTLKRRDDDYFKISHVTIDTLNSQYNFKNVTIDVSEDSESFLNVYSSIITDGVKVIDLGCIYKCKAIRIGCKDLIDKEYGYGIFNLILKYDDTYLTYEWPGKKGKLSINRTLKTNLPSVIEPDKDEIHFTEDGEIYINDNEGNLIKCNAGEAGIFEMEMETLFEGSGEVGEYILANDVNKYSFLFVTYEMKREYEENISLIPPMTSNTTPSPYIASALSEQTKASGAFDGTTGTGTNTWYSTTGFPQWLNISTGSSISVSGFSLTNGVNSSGYANYPPKSFIFQGSNNGITYDDLLTVTNMNQMGGSEEVIFELDSPVNYSNYRWYFTEGYSSAIIIGEAKLFGELNKIENTDVVIPDEKTEHHIELYDKSTIVSFKKNHMNIGYVNGLTIKKVVGIKGQLPALL